MARRVYLRVDWGHEDGGRLRTGALMDPERVDITHSPGWTVRWVAGRVPSTKPPEAKGTKALLRSKRGKRKWLRRKLKTEAERERSMT